MVYLQKLREEKVFVTHSTVARWETPAFFMGVEEIDFLV